MKVRLSRLGPPQAALAVLICCMAAAAEDYERCKEQLVYVPVYSHIYVGDRERPFPLAATVSIRNTDPRHAITVLSVDFHNSEGQLVRHYLNEPAQLKPLATIRHVVKESDREGGSGASFLVQWRSGESVSPPVVESVMIGTRNQQGISFTSRGRVIPSEN